MFVKLLLVFLETMTPHTFIDSLIEAMKQHSLRSSLTIEEKDYWQTLYNSIDKTRKLLIDRRAKRVKLS